MIGNITVNNDGSFVREFEMYGRKIREGIYSPITQNERHRQVIKELREKEKGILGKFFLNKNFDTQYIPIVVMANPKTILNARYTSRAIRDKIIRADQLVQFIKDMDASDDLFNWTLPEVENFAKYFLGKNISDRSDYVQKYREMVRNVELEKNSETKKTEFSAKELSEKSREKLCPKCGKPLKIRTATKGAYVGKQFYGCSSFPKCRYMENIDK
ncbi:Topoisomerase DNA binding C4 zinc finger [Lachnospiraceae bacterium RM5]|nr:Topoisomerase DNA binding C4 zinc finger [Lachnospiraceae bacterium RM5]